MNFLLSSIELAIRWLKLTKTCFLFSRNNAACPVSLSMWQVVTRCQLLKQMTNYSITTSQNQRKATSLSMSTFKLKLLASLASVDWKITLPFSSIICLMPYMVSRLGHNCWLQTTRYWLYFTLYCQGVTNFITLSTNAEYTLLIMLFCFYSRDRRIVFRDADVSIAGLARRCSLAPSNSLSTSAMSQWQGWATSIENRYGIFDFPHTDSISMTLLMLAILRKAGPTFRQLSLSFDLHLYRHLLLSQIWSQPVPRLPIRLYIPSCPSLSLVSQPSMATLIFLSTLASICSQGRVSQILFFMWQSRISW